MRRLGLLACAVVLAGCGGAVHNATPAPRLPRVPAHAWANQSDAVAAALAAGDSCTAHRRAAALRSEVIAAVNDGKIPERFLEPLTSAVYDLAGRITCRPPPAPAAPTKEDG